MVYFFYFTPTINYIQRYYKNIVTIIIPILIFFAVMYIRKTKGIKFYIKRSKIIEQKLEEWNQTHFNSEGLHWLTGMFGSYVE